MEEQPIKQPVEQPIEFGDYDRRNPALPRVLNQHKDKIMGYADDSMLSQEQRAMQMQQRAMQMQQQDDPFAATQYNDVNMPDQPISYGGGMAEQLLNDNEVPDDIKLKFWNIFHKDNVLTFLDEKRKESKLLNFDIMKIDMLNAMPYYDYDFDKEMQFNILRNVYETKLDRALGFKGGNIKNERIILQSQFSEQRQINETGNDGQIREGFFKRLLKRR